MMAYEWWLGVGYAGEYAADQQSSASAAAN